MEDTPNSANAEEAPGYHVLLTELQQLIRSGSNKERYERLFEQLAKNIFDDFWGYCENLVRRLTTNRYYININETEDILQEVLIKIFRKVDSYSGKSNAQAQSWICQIIRRTILDASKSTSRRGNVWAHLASWIRPFWNLYGENRRSDD